MAINDVWEINQEWRDANESGLYRAHYKEEEGQEPDLEAAGLGIVSYFHVQLRDAIKLQVSFKANLVCTTCQKVTVPGSRVFSQYGSGETGDKMGDPIATGLAVLFSKYTNINGRSQRGRMFAPFVEGLSAVGGVVTNAAKLALTAMADAILFDEANVTPVGDMCGVVWSDKLKTSEDITNVILKPVLGSQRRRTNPHQEFAS